MEYPAVWIGKDFADELGVKAGTRWRYIMREATAMKKWACQGVMKNVGVFANTGADNILVDFASGKHKRHDKFGAP